VVLDIARLIGFGVVVLLFAYPLGLYMARVFSGERTWLTPVLAPVERVVYRLAGIDPDQDMPWTVYAISLLVFNFACFAILYLMLRFQGVLPLNPTHAVGMRPDLAFNTAVSFVANTDMQAYAGETAVSHLVQMAGITWQMFISTAVGAAVLIALIRAFGRKQANAIGNFWVDLTRMWLYVLLPICVVLALAMMSQGTVQTLAGQVGVKTVEGATQTLRVGPIASMEAIKTLGVDGGGFFNANSAHPFENPTPLTDWLQMLTVIVIPAGLVFTFGKMAGNMKQAIAVFAAMAILFGLSVGVMYGFEAAGNPVLTRAGVDQVASATQSGGNMEGKETRFGVTESTLFASLNTAGAGGNANLSMSSMTPISGGMALWNLMTGEVVFGGVGCGLYTMLTFALLAVFIAGLMVGRTPEYLGKSIGSKEIKLAMLAVLAMNIGILVFTAIALAAPAGLAGRLSLGPHGLSEILYALTSAVGNNGTTFPGLNISSQFYTTMIGLNILIGRYLLIVPVLAVAGSMAAKTKVPPSAGTFPTDTPLFTGLLIGVVVIVGALTFFPVATLGPILEHVLMTAGKLF
jgi:K+-transporting ATPase ATPase A chain